MFVIFLPYGTIAVFVLITFSSCFFQKLSCFPFCFVLFRFVRKYKQLFSSCFSLCFFFKKMNATTSTCGRPGPVKDREGRHISSGIRAASTINTTFFEKIVPGFSCVKTTTTTAVVAPRLSCHRRTRT